MKRPASNNPVDVQKLDDEFRRYLCQTSDEPMGIVVERAYGATIVDASGKQYLDFLSGIGVANVGHANPVVVRAVKEQVERYLHVMVYGEFVEAPQVELARLLAEVSPPPLSVTYLANSGTEAVEGALKTARKHTRRRTLVAFEGSYHGDTMGSLSVMGSEGYREPFEPLLPGVRFLPFDDETALQEIDEEVAAVIVEPIQGEAGVRVPHDRFLPALRRRCDEVGALLIFDEVMTGFGRTGRLFALQHWGVVPDILVMAKAMGGGMPIGGFTGRPEVMRTLARDPAFCHVTTFGGHPVSSAAGVAALRFLLEHRLPERAEEAGRELQRRLRELASTGGIHDVRGKGLLIGLELESPSIAKSFVRHCLEAGLLVSSTLYSDTVIRLAPPLIVSPAEVERAIQIMEDALRGAVG